MCNHVLLRNHMADMSRLSGLTCCLPSFTDIQGKRAGCDFLDLGDEVGLSPSLGTRGGLYRMRLP
jgi:hypothetical protein